METKEHNSIILQKNQLAFGIRYIEWKKQEYKNDGKNLGLQKGKKRFFFYDLLMDCQHPADGNIANDMQTKTFGML